MIFITESRISELPFDENGSIYHLGLKPGELANRIITVGDAARAISIGSCLSNARSPKTSARQFTVVNGEWKGFPISIVSIGMGYPNMEIFVREARAITVGTLWIIRLGSCGALQKEIPIGSFIIPEKGCLKATVSFHPDNEISIAPTQILPDSSLTTLLMNSLRKSMENELFSTKHCSTDTFYHSQGRYSEDFEGDSQGVRNFLVENGIQTLEMETFWLLFEAQKCKKSPKGPIYASAVMIAIANREIGSLLQNHEKMRLLEIEAAKGCLEALANAHK